MLSRRSILLFGISPIRADMSTWLTHYVPFYA